MALKTFISLILFSITASFNTIQTADNGKQSNCNTVDTWDKNESWDSIKNYTHPYQKEVEICKVCTERMIAYAQNEGFKFDLLDQMIKYAQQKASEPQVQAHKKTITVKLPKIG